MFHMLKKNFIENKKLNKKDLKKLSDKINTTN